MGEEEFDMIKYAASCLHIENPVHDEKSVIGCWTPLNIMQLKYFLKQEWTWHQQTFVVVANTHCLQSHLSSEAITLGSIIGAWHSWWYPVEDIVSSEICNSIPNVVERSDSNLQERQRQSTLSTFVTDDYFIGGLRAFILTYRAEHFPSTVPWKKEQTKKWTSVRLYMTVLWEQWLHLWEGERLHSEGQKLSKGGGGVAPK